ncbi:hypothetical protein KVG96_04950 [Pseudomonas sp. COR58]|uniref:DUF4262 domain-containing protein n=1 Tax=Pseudomonas ekonensis TaxID=2842353 RepID=A0ABS6PBA8_9PSED|nr:hypothetical protein [Pseudomonas ekonensis]MBV4457292.1 hypothetical protein [Pseudomonas ekonensis]
MSGLRASMRLYGLVKNLGSTDNPHRQAVDILCTVNRTGGNAIRAFVSRLDAELMARSAGLEGYRVIPLRTFDPNVFIGAHRGWLMLHVCCGFTAPSGQAMLHEGTLSPMGWYVYLEAGRWTDRHYLELGPQMAGLLQDTYRLHGLRHYNDWLNELDDATPAELAWQADQAWQRAQTVIALDGRGHRHGLFDPTDNRWRFAATDIDIHQPHPEPLKQGALN